MKTVRFGRTKGFIAGVLAMLVLSSTVVMASSQMREIFFNVSVNFNGEAVQFNEDSQPFIMDGRTFLPVRAIADIAGLDVAFDYDNNIVLLTGSSCTPDIQPLATSPSPIGDSIIDTSMRHGGLGTSVAGDEPGQHRVRVEESVSIYGTQHDTVITYRAGSQNPTWAAYSVHDLGGRYTRLVGTAGHVDNSGPLLGSGLRIVGDGVTLASLCPCPACFADGHSFYDIDIDISGVNVLRIELRNVSTFDIPELRAVVAIAAEVRP